MITDNTREVPGFEEQYLIDISTPEGKCWSIRRNKYLSNKLNERDKRIYWILSKDMCTKTHQAAKWIAITFPELVQNEWFEGAEIDHIDGDKLNNRPSNLRWVTRKENENNPNTIINRKKSHNSKSVEQYTLEGEFLGEYPSVREAARQTGIAFQNISAVCNKKNGIKQTGGYYWEFK